MGCGLYALFCVGLYIFQERLLFYPSPLLQRLAYPFRSSFEEHFIPVKGSRLNAVLLKTANTKGLVIYYHGNAGNILLWEPVSWSFLRCGYDDLLVDYRGYGKSGGRIQSEAQLLSDAEAAYQWALARYPESQIVLCGRSIGSGLSTYLASIHRPQKRILESAYFSLLDMKKHLYPFVPDFLLRYTLRTDLWMGGVRCPIFLIHGRQDALIPFSSSERLLALTPTDKKLFDIPEAGHDDLTEHSAYDDAVRFILEQDPSSDQR